MSLDVKVPAAGESITSANVARWHKKNGDSVAKGEILIVKSKSDDQMVA